MQQSYSNSYALIVAYTALAKATALATGKPVEDLANHLVREMMDENTPPDARDFLERLAQD
jgi:hypothetical protein